MINITNNESYSKNLLIKACNSTISLWNEDSKSFIRNINSYLHFYPTATLHGLSALLDCGIYSNIGMAKHFKDSDLKNVPSLDHILSLIFYSSEKLSWVDEFFKKSSHGSKRKTRGSHRILYNARILIILERLLTVLDNLCEVDPRMSISDGYNRIEEILQDLLNKCEDDIAFFPEPGISPLPILNLTLCVTHYDSISKKINRDKKFINGYEDRLKKLVMGHINYHMARFNGTNETSFDPVSLATALYAASILFPEFKYTSFFNSCLQVIASNQNSNGCWPSGVSISFTENGDVVQLPSVEIAVFIAETVIDENILINYNDNIKQTLDIVLPAFRKFAKYLEITFQNNIQKDKKLYSGWASDRIGRNDFIETWITAQANRFLYRYWLAEKASLRNLSLEKFGIPEYRTISLSKNELLEMWNQRIIEPDHTTTPTKTIIDEYVTPILNQKKPNTYIFYPSKDKMSFIIFGPPGSGKTYFIEQMAKCIDWPLVELSPGHFIKNGIEFIESTTKEIFDLLNSINHAVVFFDECDELFRSRDDKSTTRTILSFATASMLPKLQKLHDKGQIILVLGTNYLQNIDQAIRRPGRFDDILIFDRPDLESRKKHIKSYFDKRKTSITEEEINILVEQTEFYTIKEIIKSCQTRNLLKENTVSEYKDWCSKTGSKELEYSRYSQEIQNKIKKDRWKI